jgi:predicted RNase H-like nuclease
MASILAIDAAWTAFEPSGIALLHGEEGDWRCQAVAPSYEQFVDLVNGSRVDWTARPTGNEPAVEEWLRIAEHLNGAPVDLVTVDMPLSMSVINGRRAADDAISRAFGGRGCGTHTPNVKRPGEISDQLRIDFAELGYPLGTTRTPFGTTPALIEVYPHPALLLLLGADYRVPYKASRAGRYWPLLSPTERRRKIAGIWQEIYGALAANFSVSDLPLPTPDEAEHLRTSELKRFEDGLDALICGWVGIGYLQGRCTAYGDETAAIWTPSPKAIE